MTVRKINIPDMTKKLLNEINKKFGWPDATCTHPLSSEIRTIVKTNQTIIFIFLNKIIF